MTKAELSKIEDTLGVKLPSDYKSLMINYPFSLNSPTAEWELCDKIDKLIEYNLGFKQEGGLENTFFIGSDGSEEYYFLELGKDYSPIYVYEIETGSISKKASTLNEWVKQIELEMTELRADEMYMQIIIKNKKWWQFWI